MTARLKHRMHPPLQSALLILLCFAGTTARADPSRLPVLAVDPLPGGAELESHTAAVSRWVSRGYAKAVLLHIDTGSRTLPLGADQEAALAKLRTMPAAPPAVPAVSDAAGGRRSFDASFVRAVVSLGIAREAHWIVPSDHFRRPDPESALRADLKQAGFLEEELRSFVLRNGCFRGTVEGSPFSVCGLDELPRIADPVLVALDTNFVMSAAALAGTNPVAEMRKLLTALAGRNYSVLDSVVLTSVEPESASLVSPDLRWIGETIVQALQEPALLARSELPKRWVVLQTLARLERVGDFFEMMHQVSPYLSIHDEDPALHLYAADALAGRGSRDEALGHAERACLLRQGYCYGLPWIGLRLFAAGDIDGGEEFFAAGEKLRPGMLYGQLARGLVLQKTGRREGALLAFLGLSEAGDVLPGAFLAGALHLQMGDRQAARRQFDRALEALPTLPGAQVTDPDTAHAIREAARFYREEGLGSQAELLENNTRLWHPQPEEPPVSP